MEDSLTLAACLHEHDEIVTALEAYEVERRPVVESTQRAAQASLEWFEAIDMYTGQEPVQFAFNLLTRSRRITQENLRLRDPEFAHRVEAAFANKAEQQEVRPAMFQPFKLGQLELKNRILLSPMNMYTGDNGMPTDFHLVHLGSKAMGGAGLIMAEMTAVSEAGRITPNCVGIYTDAQRDAWGRIVDYVHEHSTAKIGMQIGHAGRKGSTKIMWEGIDQPLESGNWPTTSASAIPYGPDNQVPAEIDREGMDEVIQDFVDAARRADEAGFDLIEIHAAHGYLLSAFLSPISNQRTDEYGGSMENRAKFPLEVFDAVREVWPAHKPISVRISATDWIEDGNTAEDGVAIARLFAQHGADAIDVSTGQVDSQEKPAFG